MKRFNMILGMTLALATAGFAEQGTLIDFSLLVPDQDNLHAATAVDFSKQAGTSYTAEEKAAMKVSLSIDSWEVELASSAKTVGNTTNSMVRASEVKGDASKFAGSKVMGVRVHFPEYAVNSYAFIKPPFEIPAYATQEGNTEAKPGSQFDGFGVIKNVGVIKSIQLNALGRNFPNGVSVVLEDQNGVEQQVFIGYMNFDGWKALQWNNPNYQSDVRNRELYHSPLYPKSSPMVKLKGLIIHRDSSQEGGDFISYFKDIKVIYDLAVIEKNVDVDDEGIWGILQKREEESRNYELARLGNLQVLRKLEVLKMATDKDAFDAEAAAPAATTTN
ncbi:MAG: flagellar protein [Spirochaetes bacterium GWB1_48_6]|nr:MAG: flagellar protein [Spirochaetes bacterium GWB1_48_6]